MKDGGGRPGESRALPGGPPGRYSLELSNTLLPLLYAPRAMNRTMETMPKITVAVMVWLLLLHRCSGHRGGRRNGAGVRLELEVGVADGPHLGDVHAGEFRLDAGALADDHVNDEVEDVG